MDNVKVRDGQIARLKQIKATRDGAKVKQALDALTAAAKSGTGNLLALSIDAVRLRATVGEISDALETIFGRHRADIQKVTGVYAAAYDSAAMVIEKTVPATPMALPATAPSRLRAPASPPP